MVTSRTLGVGLTPLETRRDVVLHVATRAEQLGYESFHLAEGWGHDAAVLLSEVAVRTSRIRIGTGVLNVWGRSPATIAMLATSLHEVSGGRFTLGLGAGSPQLAEGLHDVAFDAPVAHLSAVVWQVRRLLDGERLIPSAPREHRPLRLATGPTPGLPIHIAALGPAAVRLAGELADGWCPFCCRPLPSANASNSSSRARLGVGGPPHDRRSVPASRPRSHPIPSRPGGSRRGGWRSTSPAWARCTGRHSDISVIRPPSTRSSPPIRPSERRRSPRPPTYCSTSSRCGGMPPPRGDAWTAGTQRELSSRS
jgi:hypothetical protein